RVLEVFDCIFDVLKPSDPKFATAGGPGNSETALLSDADIERLIEERTQAKKSRDFKRADEIRALFLEKGIVLEDTKDGVRWKRA
ncbi:MAG: cysteine--tRNA ligase, partial [Acidobacteria bacterium]|nr:cysteine--tRNA ligase [Acidobacteriota bacterium]